ncbi:hypothetical protein ABTY61_19970 [Kitasatospora sp. NPDC096128]|uniref:hypothetical protein n=1 Tax=Kitasatospora sp. NPDC096128 TaxID=3155547 RepID=UPI00332FBE45
MTATATRPPADPQLRSRWGLFARRDFRLLWAGQTVSRLGGSVTTVALPLVAVLTLDAGPFASGLLTAAIWLPWPDRVSGRRCTSSGRSAWSRR